MPSYFRKSPLLAISLLLTVGLTTAPPGAADVSPESLVIPADALDGLDKLDVKHIIVMVADGWSYNYVDAASIWRFGTTGGQIYHDFPVQLGVATYDYGRRGHYDPEAAWGDFEWVMEGATDSAASATALSTGVRTISGQIGLDPDGEPLVHTTERARNRGMATGAVTSVLPAHASPAGFFAHTKSRSDYDVITRQMIREAGMDVLMGPGHPEFDNDGQPTDNKSFRQVVNKNVWKQLKAGELVGANHQVPWTLIETREDFMALQEGDTPGRVLGMPQVRGSLQFSRSGEEDHFADPFVEVMNTDIPTLAEMSSSALNVLSQNPNGFFLIIEGGAVDWAGHANHSGRMIEEMQDFDYSVEAVVEWVEANSNWDETLLVITGDHETGYLTGPDSGPGANPMWQPIENRGKGQLPGMEWHSSGHTNMLIPLYAKGTAASYLQLYIEGDDPVRGDYVHLTAVGKLNAEILSD